MLTREPDIVNTPRFTRSRLLYAVLIVIVIVLGLASRRYSHALPPLLATTTGDALWALCVFLFFGFLRPAAPIWRVAVAALVFAFAIEFSQLYHAPWIDILRHQRLGGLILGFGFRWDDLLCYTIGVGIGAAGEWTTAIYLHPAKLKP